MGQPEIKGKKNYIGRQMRLKSQWCKTFETQQKLLQRDISGKIGLPQKARKISNKQHNRTCKGARKRTTKSKPAKGRLEQK